MNYETADQRLTQLDSLGSRLGLETMRELCRRLGDPQDQIKTVHVAGTNGKGSTIAYLASIARAAGVKCGAYTSPALECWRENIRIDGEWISRQDAAEFLTTIFDTADQMVADGFLRPTRFETETALSFLYFAEKQCELALIETGLGGLMDATNVIKKPALTILTSISLDHTQILGNTLEKIAEVKCGIIKEGVPLVTAPQPPAVMAVIKKTCASAVIAVKEYKLPVTIKTAYQWKNAGAAVSAAQLLGFQDSHILEGIKTAEWFGRFSVISENPVFIVDGAHNPDGAAQLIKSLKKNYGNQKYIFLVGFFRDKDYITILNTAAPHAKKVIAIDMPENKRLLRANDLKTIADKYHNDVIASLSPLDAVKRALEAAGRKDIIVSFGSLSTVRAIEQAVKELTYDRQS